jgi:hypothetical protein
MQQQIQTVKRSVIIAVLVSAYLSTWSAALVHSLVFPALGVGPASVSASRVPKKEGPQICFPQRRHLPPEKSISLVAPTPTDTNLLHVPAWAGWVSPCSPGPLPPTPLVGTHSGRAPPAC